MAQQVIGIGTTLNDGTGDPIRTAFSKTNDNFTELYATVAAQQPLGQTAGINAQTGTTYTLVADDRGKLITCDNAAAITVTTGSSAVHSAGDIIHILQVGAGQVSIVAGAGVTVSKSAAFNASTLGQYSMVSLFFVSATQAYLVGTLEAV